MNNALSGEMKQGKFVKENGEGELDLDVNRFTGCDRGLIFFNTGLIKPSKSNIHFIFFFFASPQSLG